jgi:hypothetical protein
MEESGNIIVFQEFDNAIAANLSKTKLDAYGVPCFLTEENLANLYPGNQFISISVRLHLFEGDAERAREILNTPSLLKNEESDVHCPSCKSMHLERDFPSQFYKKASTTLGVLFFGIFIPQKKIYRCLDCLQEFE